MNNIPRLTKEEAADQSNLLRLILVHAARGERTKCLDFLVQLGEKAGPVTVLYMLANWIVLTVGPDEFGGFVLVNSQTRAIENPDQVFPDPSDRGAAVSWCMRFLVATANKDSGMQSALIGATPNQDAADIRMVTMLEIAGQEMARLLAEPK